jgi:membrane protein implicated in regulation of membrane protease activity
VGAAEVPASETEPGGSLWWLVWLVAIVALLAVAARAMRRTPPQRTLTTRTSADEGTHHIVMDDAGPHPRLEVRMQPRVDVGEQQVEDLESVLIQQHRGSHVRH